ncbi:MAG: S-adenosylmethionine decarboxylase [Clostridia bacterium]|nr:S-adenosylmethionine decarboxylase [Clostridia bacterium]
MDAQMFNYRVWIKYIEVEKLKERMSEMLEQSGFNTLRMCEHYFDPEGYTGLWLLSESHIAVHTFPEEAKVYIELSSCVERPFQNFVKLIENHNEIELLD